MAILNQSIISFCTIGFGDYSPTNHVLDPVTFSFIFVGLALVSMCVAVVQKRMEINMGKLHKLMMQQAYKVSGRAFYNETEMKAIETVISMFPFSAFVSFRTLFKDGSQITSRIVGFSGPPTPTPSLLMSLPYNKSICTNKLPLFMSIFLITNHISNIAPRLIQQ